MVEVAYLLLGVAWGTHLWQAGRRFALPALGLALAAWTVALGQRAADAGHWPLANRYEFALTFTWMTLGLILLLEAEGWRRGQAAYAVAVAFGIATYAVTRSADQKAIAPLLPALRSPWLQLHALTAALAYAGLTVAAGAALALLRHPDDGAAAVMVRRMVGVAFPWLTLSMLAGAIWAEQAWGRYWGWDPKESWALILWLWTLLPLHLAPLPRWRGRRLAVLVLVDFALLVFTFVGVPWLVRLVRLESLHGY